MAELNSLEELGGATGTVAADVQEAPVHVQKLDAQGRAYATGKRKDAVARVWIKPGTGRITVGGKNFTEYFARPVLQMVLQQPIVATNRAGQYDIGRHRRRRRPSPARLAPCVTASPRL